MSGPAGAAPPMAALGLDVGGPRHWKTVQESAAPVQTHPMTGSVQPPPREGPGSAGGKAPLRLPSLVAAGRGPRRRSSVARLSLSEPSLLTLNDKVHFEGFSNVRRPPPPPPPFSKSCALLPCRTRLPSGSSQNQQNRQKVPGCSRRVYIHFSQAIQPRSRPARRHSHSLTPSADTARLGPLALRGRSAQSEPLTVTGKPYLPSRRPRLAPAAASGPARAQLHVFLPTDAEGEEVDRESVDEGFMDELDCKMTSLKLQQGALKTLTYH